MTKSGFTYQVPDRRQANQEVNVAGGESETSDKGAEDCDTRAGPQNLNTQTRF